MTSIDLPVLRQRLQDAEAALHRLMVGEMEVTVSVTGYGSTTYTQTSTAKLEQYISQLKAQIAQKTGRKKRSPIYFRF